MSALLQRLLLARRPINNDSFLEIELDDVSTIYRQLGISQMIVGDSMKRSEFGQGSPQTATRIKYMEYELRSSQTSALRASRSKIGSSPRPLNFGVSLRLHHDAAWRPSFLCREPVKPAAIGRKLVQIDDQAGCQLDII